MANRFVEKLRNFADLGAAEVAALDRVTAAPRKYGRYHDLIREGDRPGPVFVALDGWACRYKILPSGTRQVVAFLMPGDCCDLRIDILAEMDHSIQTITPAVVATVSREDMEDLLDRFPAIAKAIYTSQLIDEGILRSWIVSMGRRTSIERVAHLMCELYLRARNIGLCGDEELILPISQLMLADALGMTAVHINRVLKTLRLTGAMTLQRGSLRITDSGKLVQLAGFDENYLHRRLRRAA